MHAWKQPKCHTPLTILLSSFPHYHRADRERPAGTQWNGDRLLPEPLRPSPRQPHPKPLRHTAHASQPDTHTSSPPREPQLPAVEGSPCTWPWQRASIQATFSQLSTNGPPSVSVCLIFDTEMMRWRDSHSSSWTRLSLAPSLTIFLPWRREGDERVSHTPATIRPFYFLIETDCSNCCPASLWTSWSGT